MSRLDEGSESWPRDKSVEYSPSYASTAKVKVIEASRAAGGRFIVRGSSVGHHLALETLSAYRGRSE